MYTIGVDFGNSSARAVLIEIETGEEKASYICDYTNELSVQYPEGYSIQNPNDYIEALERAVNNITSQTAIRDIKAIGIDVSPSVMFPVAEDGTPLADMPDLKGYPDVYAKNISHTASKRYADKINQYLGEKKAECSNFFAKLAETLDGNDEIASNTAYYMEMGDWLVWRMTGILKRSLHFACINGLYDDEKGIRTDLGEAVCPKFNKNMVRGKIAYSGESAGGLNAEFAKRLGLREGTVVSVANADLQACVPAVKVYDEGVFTAVMGEWATYMAFDKDKKPIKANVVKDSVIKGYYGYISERCHLSDVYGWILSNGFPPEYYNEAQSCGRNLHSYVAQLMGKQKAGEKGLVASDDFTVFGKDINTKPEDIYRAIIESTAFSARRILEKFREGGLEINEMKCVGTLPERNPFIMQIFSDILNLPIKISMDRSPAIGSAIFAAQASGSYDTLEQACEKMGRLKNKQYYPIAENVEKYNDIYNVYLEVCGICKGISKEMSDINL